MIMIAQQALEKTETLYDRVFLEYRHSKVKADDGILIRFASSTGTALIDVNALEDLQPSKFGDSFLNPGKKIALPAPLSLELTVMFKANSGLTVRITRTAILEKAKKERKAAADALK